jgi:hypothetical protein
MMRRLISALLLFLFSAFPCLAAEFSQPLICDYGQDCFIQNYVDVDPSPEWRDFTCGSLSYDGHKGTDFRVPWADYKKGVEVVAAAPGTVLRVRDGVPDRDYSEDRRAVDGIEAGNAVIIRHDDGLETMYAHMKKGSVRVRPGDKVKRGQVLGLVGLSGMTVFPHLHFGVRRQDQIICPFLGEEASKKGQCGVQPDPLWTPETGTRLAYIPAGLLQAGFFASQPSLPEVLRIPMVKSLSSYSRVLIYAVTAFGVRAGDLIRMRIFAPSGELFVQNSMPVKRNQAQRMVLIGKKRGDKPAWPTGTYRGQYQLLRNGKIIVEDLSTVEVH